MVHTNASQVSRWVNNKSVPHADTVGRMEEILGTDVSRAFAESLPAHELYVSAPITGLGPTLVEAHHDAVSLVMKTLETVVNSPFWPGAGIHGLNDLTAADIATERNFRVMAASPAFLYLQFEEITAPSSALIELGFALGKRIKTTVIRRSGLKQPFMLDGFGAVAERLNCLPQARLYTVDSAQGACELIRKDGRELLGLA